MQFWLYLFAPMALAIVGLPLTNRPAKAIPHLPPRRDSRAPPATLFGPRLKLFGRAHHPRNRGRSMAFDPL